MTVLEKVAYIQGMFDGLELDKESSKEAKILSELLDVLKQVGEELNTLSDGLSDVESTVYFDGDDDDCGEDYGEDEEDECCCGHHHHHHHGCGHGGQEDSFYEAACPGCGEHLAIDESVLEAGTIVCPACGQKFAVSVEDGHEEEDPE